MLDCDSGPGAHTACPSTDVNHRPCESIERAFQQPLNGQLFERCAVDLLRDNCYPNLRGTPDGRDDGIDGVAGPDAELEFVLVATTAKDFAGNLRKSVKRHVGTRNPCRAVVTLSASRNAPQLVLSLALGPRQEIVRPGDLEDESFAREIQREALFGTNALFAVEAGTQTVVSGDWLVLSQEDTSIEVNSAGDLVVQQAAVAASRDSLELATLIEEDVRQSLVVALKFATTILDRIDSVHRLAHVAIIAALTGVSYQAWRTRAEHAASPNAGALGWTQDRIMVHLRPGVRTRAEIGQRADDLAHDLMVLFRRELKE